MSETNLITEAAIDQIPDSEAILEGLQAHAVMGYPSVHQLWTPSSNPEYNAAGVKVSRSRLAVSVGGVVYYLPADPTITGPPQTPRLGAMTITFEGGGGGSYSFNGTNYIYASADSGESWRSMKISIPLAGTPPYDYQWQTSADAATWIAIDTSGTHYPNNCGILDNSAYSPAIGTTSVTPLNVGFAFFTPGGHHAGLFYIRLAVTNAGGTTNSANILIILQDH